MGKAHPLELRQRVVAHVEAGNTHHSAASRFDVSVKFVNDLVKLKRRTGSLTPKRQGNPGIGKLTPHEAWVRAQVDAKGEITLGEMAARLLAERDLDFSRFCAAPFDHVSCYKGEELWHDPTPMNFDQKQFVLL